MTKVKDFDEKSDTEQWLFSTATTFVPDAIWEGGSRPNFEMSIEGHPVDANKFFKHVAAAMDSHIEKEAVDKAIKIIDETFGKLAYDIGEVQRATTEKLCQTLGVKMPTDEW